MADEKLSFVEITKGRVNKLCAFYDAFMTPNYYDSIPCLRAAAEDATLFYVGRRSVAGLPSAKSWGNLESLKRKDPAFWLNEQASRLYFNSTAFAIFDELANFVLVNEHTSDISKIILAIYNKITANQESIKIAEASFSTHYLNEETKIFLRSKKLKLIRVAYHDNQFVLCPSCYTHTKDTIKQTEVVSEMSDYSGFMAKASVSVYDPLVRGLFHLEDSIKSKTLQEILDKYAYSLQKKAINEIFFSENGIVQRFCTNITAQPAVPEGAGVDLDSIETVVKGTPAEVFAEKELDNVKDTEYNGSKYYFPTVAKEILACIKNKNNVYIYGPQGCGKTQMSRMLLENLGLKYYDIDFSAGVDESSFIGSKVATVDADGNNVIEFQYGVFAKAIKEGVPIIVNEIDFAKPHYLAALHGVLEESDPKLVILDNGGEVLRPAEDSHFMVIATANTLGLGDDSNEFHGTGSLNTAFLDRFDSFFELDYTTREHDVANAILDSKESSTLILNFVKDVRKLKNAGNITSTISTRRLKMLCEKINTMGLVKAIKNVVITRMESDDREAVKEVFQRHFPHYRL